MLRILVVDDQPLVREALLALCCQAELGHAAGSEPEGAVLAAREMRPAVAVVDASLAGGAAFRLARRLQAEVLACGLLFLDEAVRPWNLKEALRFEDACYWTKRDSAEEFVAALRAAAAGSRSFCPLAQPYLDGSGGQVRFQPRAADSPLASLTPREREVLFHLAQGYSVKECARRLDVAHSTVDNHKSRLMKKLGVHRLADLVRLALREGLLPE